MHFIARVRKISHWLLFFLALSLAVDLALQSSVSILFARCCPAFSALLLRVQRLVTVDSIFEAAKAVGICSLIVGWIYAARDRTEFGIRYSELIQELCPKYERLSLLHFAAFLSCLWLSKAKRLEGALLSLLIVLCCAYIQYLIFCRVVLSQEIRRELAEKLWEARIESHSSSLPSLEADLDSLAKAMNEIPNSDYGQLPMICYRVLTARCPRNPDRTEAQKALCEIRDFLLRLHNRVDKSKWEVLLPELLIGSLDQTRTIVCGAYYLWLDQYALRELLASSTTPESVPLEEVEKGAYDSIENELGQLNRYDADQVISGWLQTIFAFSALVSISYGKLHIDPSVKKRYMSGSLNDISQFQQDLLRACERELYHDCSDNILTAAICRLTSEQQAFGENGG